MKRNLSLDILRGVTVFGMILVNNPGPGDALSFLSHATWDGFSGADFVFPFFLFIIGASLYFAMRKSNFELNSAVAVKILKRTFWLFAIGYILNALWFATPIEDIRIMGVLQRIALVYCLAAFAVLWLKRSAPIATLSVLLLLGYWALVHFTGSYELTPNALGDFDASILGSTRIYQIGGYPFDPEGLVGTIPALCNALLGFVVARAMGEKGGSRVFVLGAAMFGFGVVWSYFFALNKPLWSSSFVLFTSGMCAMVWSTLNYIIDIKGYQRWAMPFRVFGTNAIFAYVLSQVLASLNWSFDFSLSGWLFDTVYGDLFAPWLSSLVWSFVVIGVSWIATYALYRKKIFLKL